MLLPMPATKRTALSRGGIIAHLVKKFPTQIADVDIFEHFRMHQIKITCTLNKNVQETAELRESIEKELDDTTLEHIAVELVLKLPVSAPAPAAA